MPTIRASIGIERRPVYYVECELNFIGPPAPKHRKFAYNMRRKHLRTLKTVLSGIRARYHEIHREEGWITHENTETLAARMQAYSEWQPMSPASLEEFVSARGGDSTDLFANRETNFPLVRIVLMRFVGATIEEARTIQKMLILLNDPWPPDLAINRGLKTACLRTQDTQIRMQLENFVAVQINPRGTRPAETIQ